MTNINNRSEVFLAAYRVTCSITKAAEAAELDRGMHYRWLRDDPEYAEAFKIAHDEAIQSLEDEAVRRAHEGHNEPLVFQGMLTGFVVKKYSDSLLMFLLRGAKPDKYRDRHEHTGKDGGPIQGNVVITFVKP